jgi:hypothetical protein
MRRRPSRSCTSPASAGTTAVATCGCAVANRSRSRASRSTIRAWSACRRSSPAVSDSGSRLRSFSAPAIASSADSVPAGTGLARLTTSPASGIRSSLRRSTKYAASRSASGSGAATTRNAVPSACSSA